MSSWHFHGLVFSNGDKVKGSRRGDIFTKTSITIRMTRYFIFTEDFVSEPVPKLVTVKSINTDERDFDNKTQEIQQQSHAPQ